MECYQACYGKPGNNWQLLNVSRGTPSYMVSFFENLGNSCTPQNIGSDVLLDAHNAPVILYEWISSENIVCVLRAKYGERDNFGRPKMFAHGYMMPAEGLLDDPAEVLAIDDENFRFSDAETADTSRELVFGERLTPASAMSQCNLDKDKWDRMMMCVYAMLSSPTDYPLYIKCDGDLRTIKAAIYCILYALPVSLRYQLSFSNANSLSYAKFKRVMFVDRVNSGDLYFDLDSGETNLSSELAEVEEEQGKFLSYYAFVSLPTEDFPAYCDKIRDTLKALSFGYVSELEEINLAHAVAEGTASIRSYSDEKLTRYLLQMLASAPMQNAVADDFVAGILRMYNERGLLPNDTIMKRIALRREKTTSADYMAAYKQVRMHLLLSKGTDEAVAFLEEQYCRDRADFEEWYSLLDGDPAGKSVNETFFEKQVERCADAEAIGKWLSEIRRYCPKNELIGACSKRLYLLTEQQILATPFRRERYSAKLEDFKGQAIALFSEAVGSDCRDWADQAIATMIKKLRDRFDYAEFAFEPVCIDNGWTIMREGDPTFLSLIGISDAVEAYRTGSADCAAVYRAVATFKRSQQLPLDRYVELARTVKEYVCRALYPREGAGHFDMWLAIFQLDNAENPIPSFLGLKLPVVCDPACFEKEFKDNEYMAAPEMAERLLRWFNDAIDNAEAYRLSSEEVKALKRDVKVIMDYFSAIAAAQKARDAADAAAERQRIREESRRPAEGARRCSLDPEADDPETGAAPTEDEGRAKHSKSSGFFGGLFGGKKKKDEEEN